MPDSRAAAATTRYAAGREEGSRQVPRAVAALQLESDAQCPCAKRCGDASQCVDHEVTFDMAIAR